MPSLRVSAARLLVVLAIACAPVMAQARDITVFAASSLTDALTDVGQAYKKVTDNTVHFSFASSSTLARQIVAGAPADIYVSADQRWMDYVQKHHRIVAASRTNLLANQLVLVAPRDSATTHIDIAPGFDLAAPLGTGRLAVGNPTHVPAGIYGKQALQSLHAWTSVQGHLARAANVRAALALVALGESPLGIVYRTGAVASDKVKIVGRFPDDTHKPIIYPAAMTVHSGTRPKATKSFFHFLQSKTAAHIFRQYGFKPISPAA